MRSEPPWQACSPRSCPPLLLCFTGWSRLPAGTSPPADTLLLQVVCDPAKIVLNMAPGGCTHKYQSPSSWKGKECKIAGTVGFTDEKKYHGEEYILPLSTLSGGYQP